MSAPTVFSPITKIFPQNKPIFLGKGAPGSGVTVCQSYTGTELAKTIVDSNGSWLVRSAVELPVGIYAFSAFTTGTADYAANTNVYIEANVQPPTPSAPAIPPIDTTTPSVPPATGGGLPYGSAPIVDRPANNERLTTRQPQLSGRAAANTDIYAYGKDYNPLYGNGRADSNGNWSIPLTQDLRLEPDGTAVVIVAQLSNNNTGWASPWTTVTYNLSAPTSSALPYGSKPQLTSSTTVNSLRPRLTGLAAANAIVHVYQSGGTPDFGTIKADGKGVWELLLNQDITVTNNKSLLSLIQENENKQNVSDWTDVTLDVNIAPASTALPYGSAPIVDRPANNERLTTRQPQLSGRAAANTDIYAYGKDYNPLYGNGRADSNGNWSIPLTQDLRLEPDGTAVVIVAQLSNNNTGWASPWTTVTYNLSAPTSSALPYGSKPQLTSSTTVNSLRPRLTGLAAANAIVHVYQRGGTPDFGTIKADGKGVWELLLNQDITVTNNKSLLSLIQENENKQNVSDWADITLDVNIAPTSTALPYGSAPILTSSTTVNSRRPRLTGQAAANANVRLYHAGGTPYYGSATADKDGIWSLSVITDLVVDANNNVPVAAAQFASPGTLVSDPQVSNWTSTTLTVSTAQASSALPAGSSPILTSPTTVNSLKPLITGKAAAYANVRIYHAGGAPYYGSATADKTGIWSLSVITDLVVDANNNVPIAAAQFASPGTLVSDPQVSNWTSVTLSVNLT